MERYPSIKFPDLMELNSSAFLEVSIRSREATAGEHGLKLEPLFGETHISVDVLVYQGNFDVSSGRNYATIGVPVEDLDSSTFKVGLQARREGSQTVKVKFFHGGKDLECDVEIKILVQPKKDTGRLNVTLWIREKVPAPNLEYEVLVIDGVAYREIKDTIPLKNDPETKFAALFMNVEEGSPLVNVAEKDISDMGNMLFQDLFPPDLKSYYYDNRDKIESIRVISNESWIPWEIIKPNRRIDGQDFRFLCDEYVFSRWLSNEQSTSIERELNKVKVVVPSETNLDFSKKERDWIMNFGKQMNFEVEAIEPTYEGVRNSLKKGGFDIFHFSTHGRYYPKMPDLSTIDIEKKKMPDGKEQFLPLKPMNVATMAATPLVILNACQTGVPGSSLTGMGGWAKRFIQAGVSAFIGTIWSVSDETAFKFTQELYNQISVGTMLGKAVHSARNSISNDSYRDPTGWLAYQLYGNPNLYFRRAST